mgnify:CR=1 FL=1
MERTIWDRAWWGPDRGAAEPRSLLSLLSTPPDKASASKPPRLHCDQQEQAEKLAEGSAGEGVENAVATRSPRRFSELGACALITCHQAGSADPSTIYSVTIDIRKVNEHKALGFHLVLSGTKTKEGQSHLQRPYSATRRAGRQLVERRGTRFAFNARQILQTSTQLYRSVSGPPFSPTHFLSAPPTSSSPHVDRKSVV